MDQAEGGSPGGRRKGEGTESTVMDQSGMENNEEEVAEHNCMESPLARQHEQPRIIIRDHAMGLRASINQVAGHRFQEGRVGSLVDESGIFYKPIPDGPKKERGDCEVAFYQQLQMKTGTDIPPKIRRFFPVCYGIFSIQNGDGSDPCSHLGLGDLTSGFCNPSILDIKIGKRTWHFGESEAQIQKSIKRDAGTTQESLGFRICGMQVFHPSRGEVWEPERRQGKLVTDKTMHRILKGFASTNYGWWEVSDSNCPEPNGELVEQVYGVETGVIAQLKELEKWFQKQTHFHFYSSSMLIIYDGITNPVGDGTSDPADGGDHPPGGRRKRKVAVHLIDFAHVVNGGGSVDMNFLQGLQSLICQLTAVLESHRELLRPA